MEDIISIQRWHDVDILLWDRNQSLPMSLLPFLLAPQRLIAYLPHNCFIMLHKSWVTQAQVNDMSFLLLYGLLLYNHHLIAARTSDLQIAILLLDF